ncbi:nuclease-related domain-containing protein [Rubritalea halochordaticola]|uniref:nuclease-related domain-containing protein n=1 Tax=Rubritalea halochordaticola TaxID=714537 RepID=UPI0031FC94EA
MATRFKNLLIERSSYELGFKGERYVGQLLDSLMREGCHVYHDIPCETKSAKFNIDHVVISSAGVFAVETKTYRKPKELEGKARAKVEYDGAKLHFSTGRSSGDELEQAMRNAKFLSKLLTNSTGEPVSVQGIVVLPGWFVERKGRGEALVVNPKEISQAVIDRRASPKLDPAAMRRICHQLGQLCSLK